MHYIAFDSHKRYTWARVERADRVEVVREERIEHRRGEVRKFLRRCEPGSPVAVEATGNWYAIVDEIEAAGDVPHLVHPRRAKLLMGSMNKSDKLDARGINQLQRNGTLPTVWIPPAELRDKRDLYRTRMVLVRHRTRLKNRIQASLAKYMLTVEGTSDVFGPRAEPELQAHIAQLTPQTRYATERLLVALRGVEAEVKRFEARMQEAFAETPEVKLAKTLPGVGFVLGTVIAHEIGDVTRFPRPEQLASYAGTTPRLHSSGGKTRFGGLRSDVNRYLKWAFIEAANVVCLNRGRWPDRHVVRLYERIAERRGHPKAIGAVARHLAEATYWILTKAEPYRAPAPPAPAERQEVHEKNSNPTVSSTRG